MLVSLFINYKIALKMHSSFIQHNSCLWSLKDCYSWLSSCLVSVYLSLALLFAGNYLIVITKKKKIGEFFNHVIWKATDFDVLSYKKTMLHLTDIQVRTGNNNCKTQRSPMAWVGKGGGTQNVWCSLKKYIYLAILVAV